MRSFLLFSILYAVTFMSCNGQKKTSDQKAMMSEQKTHLGDTTQVINKSEEEWKKTLTPEQYSVLRQKETDSPFTGKYYLTNEKGSYFCSGCGSELFTSDMKFFSECGWPSFDRAIEGGKIKTLVDTSYGMVRTEILCAKCGGHLGHLFDDGPTKTGLRYCVNSTSLNFVKQK